MEKFLYRLCSVLHAILHGVCVALACCLRGGCVGFACGFHSVQGLFSVCPLS